VARRLVQRLLARGRPVRGLVRRDEELPGVELVIGDVADEQTVARAVEGTDAVVHTAAYEGADAVEARRVNVEGTRRLARAAAVAGCGRFVHLSTCGAYDLAGVDLVHEDTPLWEYDEHSPLVYGVTKAEGERALVRVAAQEGLPAVVLRFPNVLGPGRDSFFAHDLAFAVRDGRVTVADDGGSTWPVVHVESVVDAIEAALRPTAPAGGAFTIVDHHTTWGEFVGRIAEWVGGETGSREARAPYDHFRGRFSTERARRELGWEPRVSYEEAMEEMRQFLRDEGIAP
jgi:2-alkyl-3-oxoalkanoate reductase